MLPEGVDIIELPAFTTARVRRLWCAPGLMYWGLLEKINERFKWDYVALPPARFAPVIHEMVRRVDRVLSPASGSERVFLARKPGLHHDLANAAAIEAAAKARGFSLVYPEALDFAEQVRLLRRARFVVAPLGSAPLLLCFATPGTKLCVLSHPYTVEIMVDRTGILSEVGICITVLTGPFVQINVNTPHLSDYEIDETGFSGFLDRWLEGGVL